MDTTSAREYSGFGQILQFLKGALSPQENYHSVAVRNRTID